MNTFSPGMTSGRNESIKRKHEEVTDSSSLQFYGTNGDDSWSSIPPKSELTACSSEIGGHSARAVAVLAACRSALVRSPAACRAALGKHRASTNPALANALEIVGSYDIEVINV